MLGKHFCLILGALTAILLAFLAPTDASLPVTGVESKGYVINEISGANTRDKGKPKCIYAAKGMDGGKCFLPEGDMSKVECVLTLQKKVSYKLCLPPNSELPVRFELKDGEEQTINFEHLNIPPTFDLLVHFPNKGSCLISTSKEGSAKMTDGHLSYEILFTKK